MVKSLNPTIFNKVNLLLSAIVSWSFFSCGSGTTTRQEGPRDEIAATRVTLLEGLAHPWSMAFLNDSEGLVTEKDGQLKYVNLATKTQRPVAGFPDDLVDDIREADPRDNAGLFDVVIDPAYAKNGWVYISYAAAGVGGTTTKVIRGRINNDSLVNVQTLLIATPYSADRFHYGGGMVFGKDGKLYITVGERFYNEKDQPEMPVAQDPTDKRGMIYRINPDGTVPVDNPDWGEASVAGAFAIGIRAAQGMALHPETGRIWFSEHGSRQGDEINILREGANYGWPVITTGKYRYEEYQPPPLPDRQFTAPAWYWQETVAPTGLTFYTGNEFPQWEGNLFVSGLSGGSLWRLVTHEDAVLSAEKLFEEDPVRSRKIVQSPDGKLYLLTDEPNGRIMQIIPAPIAAKDE